MVKENRYGKRGTSEKYRKNEQKTIAIVTPMGYHFYRPIYTTSEDTTSEDTTSEAKIRSASEESSAINPLSSSE